MNKYKTLEEFYNDQPEDRLKQIILVREVIMAAEPSLRETLKWNAPNYTYKGEDRITFNVMNKQNKVKIVIHMGATKKENKSIKPILTDAYGLIEWNSNIRGTIDFDDLNDVQSKQELLKKVITGWLALNV
jgi:uncharacterized protein YdhG (YjbR/CyaY superfamily)